MVAATVGRMVYQLAGWIQEVGSAALRALAEREEVRGAK